MPGHAVGGWVDDPAVDHQLPVHAAGPHLVLEGFYVLARHVRIVIAMEDQDLAPDVIGVGRPRRVQPAVEADHTGDVGAAAGELQDAGAVRIAIPLFLGTTSDFYENGNRRIKLFL